MSEHRYGVHDCPNGFYYLRDVTDHSVYIHRSYGKLFSEYEEDIELVSSLLNELADKVDERQATINKLKERLERINGGYGYLTHRNGLTANECLIESQERELEKKNEQISDWIERHSKDIEKISEQQNTISQLEEENEQLRQIMNDIVVATDETYTKNASVFKVTVVLDFEKYMEIRRCIE